MASNFGKNTPAGYPVIFEIYTGAQEAREPGQTVRVLLRRLSSKYIRPKSRIFINNYFYSTPLQESLKEDGIYVSHIMQFMKRIPGFCLFIGMITIKSHCHQCREEQIHRLATCKHLNRRQKEIVSISMPIIIEYIKSMGGVNLFDRLQGVYIRNKRWYYPLIRVCLNGVMMNTWMYYRHIHKEMRLVEYIRRCVITIRANPAIEKPKGITPKTQTDYR